jgi:hypothetical protein
MRRILARFFAAHKLKSGAFELLSFGRFRGHLLPLGCPEYSPRRVQPKPPPINRSKLTPWPHLTCTGVIRFFVCGFSLNTLGSGFMNTIYVMGKIWKLVKPGVHFPLQTAVVFCKSLGISSKATVPSPAL